MEGAVPQVASASTPPQLGDRRRHDRLMTRVPLRILQVNGAPASHDGMCTDVSIGGIGIDTAVALCPGQVVEFEFPGVEDTILRYRARILYRNGNHYGAYYLDVE
jgi:hypothetical protein